MGGTEEWLRTEAELGMRPTYWLPIPWVSLWPLTSLSAHLHHGVVAEAPFGATQHGPSINVDGPPALIGNEEISIVLQFDDTYGERGKGDDGMREGRKRAESLQVPSLLPGEGLEGILKMPAHQPQLVLKSSHGDQAPRLDGAAKGQEKQPFMASCWYLASGRSSRLDPPKTGPRQSGYPWLLCPG